MTKDINATNPGSGLQVKRSKPEDDPKLLAEICRLRFREDLTYKDILTSLISSGITGVRDEPHVARLIREARKRGVVYFDIDETFALEGTELDLKARSLQERFGLDRAVVVNVPGREEMIEHLQPGTNDDQRIMRADDHLHTVLANHAGKFLKDRFVAQDHWAVAGGRAVNQTVRRIRRDPPKRRSVMVTSMGGRLWSHKWWRSGSNSMCPLDPDDSAFILFLAFENEPGAMFDQVGHRVFATSREHAAAVMEEHCMFQQGGKWYEDRQPKRAIVGIGIVDPNSGHRAVRHYEGLGLVKDLMDRHLARVKSELEEAITTVRESKLYFADIANRYFPTLPLPHELNAGDLDAYNAIYQKLIKQLNDLNERMVVVEWEHIRGIPSVAAVAGGSFKLRALWTILFAGLQSNSRPLINTLVTDAKTAGSLMSALDTYRTLDPAVREWYETQVAAFFLDPKAAP